MKISVNAPCPCGRDAKYKRCCGVYHRGGLPDPVALMRARYTAYAVHDVDFIVRTTHPEGIGDRDPQVWRAELEAFCRDTRFVGLEVHEHEVDEAGGRAHVRFDAHLEQQGVAVVLSERSLFLRHEGRWKYVRDATEQVDDMP